MANELLIYINGKYYPKSEAKVSVYDHGLKDAYIRLVVTRGVGDLGLDPRKCPKATVIIITEPKLQLHAPEKLEKGICTTITWVRRNAVDSATHEMKSLNYLNSILGKIEANNIGADEAICLDKTGYVCEGVGENIFMVINGKLLTPCLSSGALNGITRALVIDLAKELGIEVIQRNITPNELFTADEVFFTGTAAEIAPISCVNARMIGSGKMGPVTKRILEAFEKVREDPSQGAAI
ncbi:MAG: aminotransferase class IV [Candidatus Bathyarchaeota archaeon]